MSDAPIRLLVLGSTGSIGVSTLEVVEHLEAATHRRCEVVALVAGRNAATLAEQARRHRPAAIGLADESARGALGEVGGAQVHLGEAAALEIVETFARPGDVVMGAMVGAAGIAPTMAAIRKGCRIALANKETLVAAGSLVMGEITRRQGMILPVDSEHSALFQAMRSGESREVRRVVLTASGGPFRTWPLERLRNATVADALAHPTWKMGRKVTIDSASLMNKALEVIEAHWLFGLSADRIEAIVHPQSVVHGFAEFVDGSVIAQLSPPDMKMPIQCALTHPERVDGCAARMDWTRLRGLEFEPVDRERFPAIDLAGEVIRRGGSAGAVFNAANEIAVEAFLAGRIGFTRIHGLVAEALDSLPSQSLESLDDVAAADAAARAWTEEQVASVAGR
ncbi:MAG: 1-deoxy-D-xylulose-5-phosphate reductoisomerase [Phycisphaerales bacterium]